jgi:hypothetical protein
MKRLRNDGLDGAVTSGVPVHSSCPAQTRQGQMLALGTFTADGTGYLTVSLDDSSGGQSGTGIRVGAQQVSFTCTSSF